MSRIIYAATYYFWGRLLCVLQALTSSMMYRLLSGELDLGGALHTWDG